MLQKNVPAGWANSPVEGSPPAHRGSGERGLSGRGGFWGFMDAAAGRKVRHLLVMRSRSLEGAVAVSGETLRCII